MTLSLPPLRSRLDEIEPLTGRFIELAAVANQRSVPAIDDEAMTLLKRYHWPGNVRELRNAIDRAVALAEDDTICREDLPGRVRALTPDTLDPPAPISVMARPEEPPPRRPLVGKEHDGLRDQVKRFEIELIMEALRQGGGDRREAANLLDLPLSTLSHKMKSNSIRKGAYSKQVK